MVCGQLFQSKASFSKEYENLKRHGLIVIIENTELDSPYIQKKIYPTIKSSSLPEVELFLIKCTTNAFS